MKGAAESIFGSSDATAGRAAGTNGADVATMPCWALDTLHVDRRDLNFITGYFKEDGK